MAINKLRTAALAALVFSAIVPASAQDGDEDVLEWINVEEPPKPFDPMVELTDETLLPFVRENPAVLVEFYAPWCGFCKMVGPEYHRAAWIVHNKSLPFKVAKLNADKYTEIADSLRISKYPSVFLYRNGQPESFPVLSVAEAYVAGAARMLEVPGAESVSPMKRWSEGVDVSDVAGWLFWRGSPNGHIATTVVLYQPPGLTGSAADISARVFAAVEGAAGQMLRDPNIRFAVIEDPSVLEAFEVPMDRPTLVLYKEQDEGRVEYELPANGAVTPDQLVSWAKVHQVPLVTVVTHKNLQAYRKKVKYLGLYFVDQTAVEHRATSSRLQSRLFGIAQALMASGSIKRGEFTLAVVDGKKYSGWMKHYGFKEGEFPAFGLEDTATEALYGLGDIAHDASCNPPESVLQQPPPPPIGSKAYLDIINDQTLPDGFDATAPYKEEDGRPLHTAPWCPGSSFTASRAALAKFKQESEAAAAVAVGADGSQASVAKPTALPPGHIPTFEEGFSHDEATVQWKLLNNKREAEGLPPLPPVGDSPLVGGFSDQLYPPLFWVDVPVDNVQGWLAAALKGSVAPARPPIKAGASISMYASMAQAAAGKDRDTDGSLHDTGRSDRSINNPAA